MLYECFGMKGYLWSPARIDNSHQTPQRLFVFLSSFFGIIKVVGLLENFTWSSEWQFSVKPPNMVWDADVDTCTLLSFVFTPVFRPSQQQVKLLQIMARGQLLQLCCQCCLMQTAQSLRNSKFLSFFAIIFIILFVLSTFYTDTKWCFSMMDGWIDGWVHGWIDG